MDPQPHEPGSSARTGLLAASLVGLAIALAAVSAWWTLDSHESQTVELEASLTSQQVAYRLEEYIASRLHGASSLDHLWERGRPPTPGDFRDEAMLLIGDLGGLQAVNWIDPQGIIRWVAPEATNRAALGRDLGRHPVAGDYLEAARATGSLQLTPPIELYQGGLGMAGYLPLPGQGTLNIVFRFADLVEGCLSRGLHEGFHYAILDGADLVHRCADWPGGEPTARQQVRVANREWQLSLRPTAARLAQAQRRADEAVLVLGLCIALLGGGLVYRLQEARRRERERKRYFRRIVDTAEEGIWAVDADGRTTFANHRLARMLGYPPEELRGRRVRDFMDEAAATIDEQMVERRRAGQRDRYETTLVRKDGHGLRVLIASAPMMGPAGEYQGTLAMVSDTSERHAAEEERRELQARVHHAQKLESLGVLTGGIAHDFNNLLTTILGHAALARDGAGGTEASLAEITRAAGRAAELCRQMLAYAGNATPSTRPVSLARRVHELRSLLAVSIPKKVDLVVDIPDELPVVEADPSQLDQVLMNLLLNAAEAIGDRPGRIRVIARSCTPGPGEPEGLAGGEALAPGDYVCIEIEDDGCGMGAEVRERLFEPFFSTKFAGRGLGMASVLGILRAHGGAIGVESEARRGSRFRVFLPTSTGRATPEERAAPPGATHGGRGRQLLVVDDEEAVRALVQVVVEAAGYRVCLAADGQEAVEAVEAAPGEFDAVVMDITMPGLDGIEAMARLRDLAPGLPVMLMSGFGAARLEDQPEGAQPDHFLAKPFVPEALLAGLEALFARSGRAPGRT